MMQKQDAADPEYAEKAVVFGPIMDHGSLLCKSEAHRIRGGDFAAVANRLCAGEENDFPSGLPTPPAPIDIIAVHEQVLIQQSHRVEGFPSDHRKTAHQDIDRACSIVGKEEHMFASEERDALELTRETGCRTEVVPQSWELAARTLQG